MIYFNKFILYHIFFPLKRDTPTFLNKFACLFLDVLTNPFAAISVFLH